MRLKLLIAAFLALSVPSLPVKAADFNYKNLVTASIKLSSDFDYDSLVDSYMQVFRPQVWQRAANDEFELHGKRIETIEIMKKSADAFNLDDPMILHTTVEFGEYDFDKKQFAMSPFDGSTYFSAGNCCTRLPEQYKVLLENPDIIDGLPMSPDAAKSFIDKHKSGGGFVARRLNADIYLKIKSTKNETDLSAEIVKVIVKDTAKGNAVLMALPKPAS